MEKFSTSQILKNIFSLSFGQIVNLLLSFLSITIAARIIDVHDFGYFSYLLAVVIIVAKLMDLGLSPIVFRELSVNFNRLDLLNSALSLRAIAYIVITLGFNIIAIVWGFEIKSIILSNLLLFNAIISAKFICFRELMEIPFKVSLKMHYPMVVTNIDNIILLFAVLSLGFFEDKLTVFIVAYSLSNLPGFLFLLFLLKRKYNFVFSPNWKNSKWLLLQSLPIFGAVLLDTIYLQIDIVLLKMFSGYYSVGIYSVATRLVFPIVYIPTAIISTLFPILANAKENPKSMGILVSFVLKFFFLFSFSIFICFYFKSSIFVELLFGNKYTLAGLTTSLLLFAQIFVYYSFFVTNWMIALNKQKLNLYYSSILIISHVIVALILIPSYSYNGIAYAKIISGLIGALFTSYFLFKVHGKVFFLNIKYFLFIVLMIFGFYLISPTQLWLYIILSVLVFVSSLFLSNFFSDEEIVYFVKILKKEQYIDIILNIKNFKILTLLR